MAIDDFESGLDRFHRKSEHFWKPYLARAWETAPPEPWVGAVDAVSRDIDAIPIPIEGVSIEEMLWLLSISVEHSLIMVELRPSHDLGGSFFIVTEEATRLDRTLESATCWLGTLLQDELAGRHHTLWPQVGGVF